MSTGLKPGLHRNTFMTWSEREDIAEALLAAHPDVDPLTVRFSDMHKWILDLEDFEGKPDQSNEKQLEAIQMAWYEEWKDEYGGK